MPITKSAKKALRASLRKKTFNIARKEAAKNSIKEVRRVVASGNVKETPASLSKAYQAIDKAVKTGIMKKNTAARKKSRLARLVAASNK